MTYLQLLPALLQKGLVQTKPPPPITDVLPPGHRADLTCVFHQGAPGHDVERCHALRTEVQNLIRDKRLRFTNNGVDFLDDPLPNHGQAVNMIQDCQEDGLILSAQDIRTPLVPIHARMCLAALFSHDHNACGVCSVDSQGCKSVQDDIQGLLDSGELLVMKKEQDVCVITPEFDDPESLEVTYSNKEPGDTPLIICVPGPLPYTSNKAIPYRYSPTILENGREMPIPPLASVSNIVSSNKILRSGRILPTFVQEKVVEPVSKLVQVQNSGKGKDVGQPSGIVYEDSDEILKLIKRSEYKVVDQLLQTPSKISIMSLLLNSDAHREALMKVLSQAYVDHDVTLGQFGSIVGNVTACNSLGFSDEDLPSEGRNHNLALHISVNCKSDALSNVLIDTGSSLNVMPIATLRKLSYPNVQLRATSVSVRAFDGSRKTVLGDVVLPISVGPQEFEVLFQVMDIPASYSCLLGRPWIHEAGAVTSTLHQKLKFVSHGKLITVSGESALLVSHLSAFSYISGGDVDEASVQGFSVEENAKKGGTCMASLKDAQRLVQKGKTAGWGQLIQLPENQRKEGLGFSTHKTKVTSPAGGTFHSAGFINVPPEINVIVEGQSQEEVSPFVIPGGICCNWIAADIPSVTSLSE